MEKFVEFEIGRWGGPEGQHVGEVRVADWSSAMEISKELVSAWPYDQALTSPTGWDEIMILRNVRDENGTLLETDQWYCLPTLDGVRCDPNAPDEHWDQANGWRVDSEGTHFGFPTRNW